MENYRKHLIKKGTIIRDALRVLDELAADAILFVVDDQDHLIGSLTDGDVRRSLIKGGDVDDVVENIIQKDPKSFVKNSYSLEQVKEYREKNYIVIPVINEDNEILNIVNFRHQKSYLPIDAVIMAGGRGSRLKPMTDKIPKPLLKIGDKPIVEHNVDRLIQFGIDDFWISLRYLGEQIEEYFKDGSDRNVKINYIWETEPLGTIGAVSKIRDFGHEHVLITNSDVLTNLDYEDFYMNFLNNNADMSVVTIPYSVDIPYAVLETNNGHIKSFREKPTYTYYSNGGIYLVKKEILQNIPNGEPYNTTDLMEKMLKQGKKVVSYPLRGYWLDIGKPEDFKKAQEDIKHVKF